MKHFHFVLLFWKQEVVLRITPPPPRWQSAEFEIWKVSAFFFFFFLVSPRKTKTSAFRGGKKDNNLQRRRVLDPAYYYWTFGSRQSIVNSWLMDCVSHRDFCCGLLHSITLDFTRSVHPRRVLKGSGKRGANCLPVSLKNKHQMWNVI